MSKPRKPAARRTWQALTPTQREVLLAMGEGRQPDVGARSSTRRALITKGCIECDWDDVGRINYTLTAYGREVREAGR